LWELSRSDEIVEETWGVVNAVRGRKVVQIEGEFGWHSSVEAKHWLPDAYFSRLLIVV